MIQPKNRTFYTTVLDCLSTSHYGIARQNRRIPVLRAVKIDGLGTWTPKIGLDGTLDIQYRTDTALVNMLKMPGMFTARIQNRENIGKTSEELVTKCNDQYPDDQVVFSQD